MNDKLTEVDLVITVSTIFIFVIVFIMVLVYTFYFRKKTELLFERQKKETQFEQELATAIIEMKETTLSYIGQELHDDLGQKMSVAKLMINHGIETTEGAQKELLLEVNEIIGESIRDIRSLSKSFITEQIVNLGLIESIQKEIDRIGRLKLLKISLEIDSEKIEINPKDSVILFRIIQECINNSLKHSRARNLSILIENQNTYIKIQLEDDGIGFNIDEKKKGSGILSMKKRANLINTDFNIISELTKGTIVNILYKKQHGTN